MKKIISNLVALLLIVAVCAALAWLLPVRLTLCVLLVVQLLTTLILLGIILNRMDYGKDEA